ncbi:MAG: hypothetical protein IT373_32080 [Polyangiaceae bacterium]|nr:hypothetical protein [Polyangiaceae bacterium]
MIELSFDAELYDGFAVDEAAKTFADFATIAQEQLPGRWLVRVTVAAGGEVDEATVASELDNFALGKTIERRLRGDAGAGPAAEGAAATAGAAAGGAAGGGDAAP